MSCDITIEHPAGFEPATFCLEGCALSAAPVEDGPVWLLRLDIRIGHWLVFGGWSRRSLCGD
jgi:hypothetical protein